jgi:hypothetical protein
VWPAGHTLPIKILGFFPKFPCKSLISLLPLIFGNLDLIEVRSLSLAFGSNYMHPSELT